MLHKNSLYIHGTLLHIALMDNADNQVFHLTFSGFLACHKVSCIHLKAKTMEPISMTVLSSGSIHVYKNKD